MTLERAIGGLRATGEPTDDVYADMITSILKKRGSDIPLPQAEILPTKKDFISRELLDPEITTSTFQAIWSARQEILSQKGVNLEFSIPQCPYTKEELKSLEAEGRRVGYLPYELSTQESRHLMAIIWPQMQSHSVKEGNSVTNAEDISGWFDYESAIDAPYTGTNEDQLKDEAKKQGRKGSNLNQYIVAGQDSKLFTGKYLDETRTWVRLLGSRGDGDVVHAYFYGDGDLGVYWYLGPRNHNSDLGGRSVGVPKAA